MLNPDFVHFDKNMFAQTKQLLEGCRPHLSPIDLSVGEPKLPPPPWVNEVLTKHAQHWQAYPKASAAPIFLKAIATYFAARFPSLVGAFEIGAHLLPVTGTREALHLLGYCVKGVKTDALAFVPNPAYHAWRAGAMAAGAKMRMLNAGVTHGFLPDLDSVTEAEWRACTIMYLCNPTNPQGACATKDYLQKAIDLARRHQFLLVVDECYIDIWRGEKPISALEVAIDMSESSSEPLANLVVLNSLSKRSHAAGLRAGFLCGDKRIVAGYTKLMVNGGSAIPTPLLHVASALYADEAHNQQINKHYAECFAIMARHLDITIPQGGFFLWLDVRPFFDGDDTIFVKKLYEEGGVKTLPGSLMSINSGGENPGAGFVRLALVHRHDSIEQAAMRLASFMHEFYT